MRAGSVFVAVRGQALRERLEEGLRGRGHHVISQDNQEGVFNDLPAAAELVIVATTPAGTGDGVELVDRLRRSGHRVPVIVLTPCSSKSEAIAALRAGANDYLEDSVPLESLMAAIRRCIQQASGAALPDRRPAAASETSDPWPLLGDSAAMRHVRTTIRAAASVNSTVLLTGETGTGKELAAELIHLQSSRRSKPFVRINCAAIPESLVESELFGHERGAFTGAERAREGLVPDAREGTVLFDEVGDMSLGAQAKILRLLENKEAQRLGAKRSVPVNVRVLAATNRDPEDLVQQGRFRSDLYYRLNVARVHIPPLRERKQDIPVLTDHYIREFNRQFGCNVDGFADEVLDCWLRYDWPGNVRELRNVVESCFLNVRHGCITISHLPEHFLRQFDLANRPPDERQRVLEALFETKWNKSRAAVKLRWSRMTLYRRIAKYRLESKREIPVARSRARES